MTTLDLRNEIREFLRTRRARITPEQAGLPAYGGNRRVTGLRREEVAMLAGISNEYYLRLEQGKYKHPSMQVLEAVARVLCLDDESVTHLAQLASEKSRSRRRRPRPESVPIGVQRLVASLPMPAFVEGRYLDVLAANPMAAAISPRLVVGANRIRDVFLDPDERDLFVDWDNATEVLVASFRQSVAGELEDPRFVELVERHYSNVPIRPSGQIQNVTLSPESATVVLRGQGLDRFLDMPQLVLDTIAEERKPVGTTFRKRPQIVNLPPGIAYEIQPAEVEFTILRTEPDKPARKP